MIGAAPPPALDEPALWSTDFEAFLERVLRKEARARLSARELLALPFIRGAGTTEQQAATLLPVARGGEAAVKVRIMASALHLTLV